MNAINNNFAFVLFFSLMLSVTTACTTSPRQEQTAHEQAVQTNHDHFDAKNSSFLLNNERVQLLNGEAHHSIKGAIAEVSTHYRGYLVSGDLNGDGQNDKAFWVSQSTGGSGVFYYVVAAIKNEQGYQTTNAFFVGDRIQAQELKIPLHSRQLQVYFATHKANEAFSEQPTTEKVLLLKVTADGILEGYMK